MAMTQPTIPVPAERDTVARATKALRSANEGMGLITADDFLVGMGFDTVRYRGLAKNASRAFVALAMANIYLGRRPLLAHVRA